MIIIGSHALNYHFPGYRSAPKDYDLVGTYEEINKFVDIRKASGKLKAFYPLNDTKLVANIELDSEKLIFEFEVAWEESNTEEFVNLVLNDPRTIKANEGWFIPPLDALYALKMSHRYLKNSPYFIKTMGDIHFLRSKNASITDYYSSWYKRRMKETYDYKHPKLNVKKDDFFAGDGIDYIYDHDTIHLAMKHLDKPAYDYFKPDNSEIFCDKNMFTAAPRMTRLYLFLKRHMFLQ